MYIGLHLRSPFVRNFQEKLQIQDRLSLVPTILQALYHYGIRFINCKYKLCISHTVHVYRMSRVLISIYVQVEWIEQIENSHTRVLRFHRSKRKKKEKKIVFN